MEAGRLQVVEILSPLLHLLAFRPPIIVLLDDVGTHVSPITDDLIGHIVVQAVSDAPPSNCVRVQRVGTLRRVISRSRLTVHGIAVVRTLANVSTLRVESRAGRRQPMG